jgi:hypothetical protein
MFAPMSSSSEQDSPEISPEDTAQMPIADVLDPSDPEVAVAALARELADAMDTLERVSKILGACARCFGLDEECHDCRGRGSPGYRASSDPGLLDYWKRALIRGQLQLRVREPKLPERD